MAHGGKREGAGRKPLTTELKVKDLVSPYIEGAIQTAANLAQHAERDADKLTAIKLLLSYYFGQPSQSVDMTTKGERLGASPEEINAKLDTALKIINDAKG